MFWFPLIWYLGESSWVESPADVVAVLDPDVSSVSYSMNSPDPTNVLQTQTSCVTLGPAPSPTVCDVLTLTLPLAAATENLDALFNFILSEHPSEPLI